jgi:hypothetical protein
MKTKKDKIDEQEKYPKGLPYREPEELRFRQVRIWGMGLLDAKQTL